MKNRRQFVNFSFIAFLYLNRQCSKVAGRPTLKASAHLTATVSHGTYRRVDQNTCFVAVREICATLPTTLMFPNPKG